MQQTVFTLPLPSSAIALNHLDVMPKHLYILRCQWDDLKDQTILLKFIDVQALKCTYQNIVSPEIINLAYDKVIFDDSSPWLKEIKHSLEQKHKQIDLNYYVIYFDDGPSYEFICRGFESEVQYL